MKRDWLVKLRKTKKMTQEQIAKNSFIDRSYYSQIESGKRNPSFDVASNIAKALDINPLLFFKELNVLTQTEIEQFSKDEVIDSFNLIEKRKILYLYSNEDSYFKNAKSFLLTGIRNNCYSLFIDKHHNFLKVIDDIPEKETGELIFQMDVQDDPSNFNELIISTNHLKTFLSGANKNIPIFIWFHLENDSADNVFNLQKQFELEETQDNRKIFWMVVYNDGVISAGTHIKLMRKFPFIKTDNEIYDSPLYHGNNKVIIYPSLVIQEKQGFS